MINIFYQPDYSKRKLAVNTLNLRDSVLKNKMITFFYIFNLSMPSGLITNGPHKRMNHLIRSFGGVENSSFNKDTYSNSYIVQFDWYGEEVLNSLIKNNKPNKKILVGPLYTDEQLVRLQKYLLNYSFIKVVAASRQAADYISSIKNLKIDSKKICVFPSGVISEKNLKKITNRSRNEKCLIYFKNRDMDELHKVIDFLGKYKIKYDLFEYGKYKNNKLKKTAKNNKFGFLLNSSESQGFAVQELMICGLPLYVWNIPKSKRDYPESSVPYFSDKSGLVNYSFSDVVRNFEQFIEKIDYYDPHQLIFKELTYEKFVKNINFEFSNFNKKT